jgi:cytochrome d ubiquinol oxidase subunit I
MYRDFSTPVVGLDRFHPEVRPPVRLPFFTYHLMIGLGTFFVMLTVAGSFFLWRGTLFTKRWLMWLFVFAVLGAYLANQAGWVSAEVGRQPFVVYPEVKQLPSGIYEMSGGMRTVEGLSSTNAVTSGQVIASIIMFSLVYAMLFMVWVYVLNSKIQKGPDYVPKPAPETSGRLLEAAAALLKGGGSLTTAKQHHQSEQEPRS